MCRLFALHAGAEGVAATFWLVDAADSLSAQSHRNPDGAGIGVFTPDGTPVVDKQPLAAWQDDEFASAARTLRSSTFVAHVRYASTGARTLANTHPFTECRRVFAHNGVLADLPSIDARLRARGAGHLVHGDTDSERLFRDDHGRDGTLRRRRHSGTDGGRRVGHRPGPRLCAQPRHGHRNRPVGAPLPGHPRALRARPTPRGHRSRPTPGGTDHADPRPISAPGVAARRGRRQRADG